MQDLESGLEEEKQKAAQLAEEVEEQKVQLAECTEQMAVQDLKLKTQEKQLKEQEKQATALAGQVTELQANLAKTEADKNTLVEAVRKLQEHRALPHVYVRRQHDGHVGRASAQFFTESEVEDDQQKIDEVLKKLNDHLEELEKQKARREELWAAWAERQWIEFTATWGGCTHQ